MTEQYDYDVLFIGGGHAAFDGAGPLAASGKKVALVTDDKLGGTCTNRGCNAKIALDEPVAVKRMVERIHGQLQGEVQIDWPAVVAHKQAIIKDLPQATENKLKSAGVTIIKQRAKLLDPQRVQVADGTIYSAAKIVVATGQRPNRLAIPGDELAHDSSEFMDLTAMPQSIAILGAGYISYEFATIANAVGAKVTVFMHGDQGLRNFYQPYVKQVTADLTKRGVTFIPNAAVSALKRAGNGYRVFYGDDQSATVEWVLDATGRVPNVEDLGLAELGVKYTKHGIQVDDHLQTSIPNVYAAGDVVDKVQPKLTPTATYESYYLYRLFSGQTTDPLVYPPIPTTVYTSPRIAQVGVSPSQTEGTKLKVIENHIPDDWYRQIDSETMGDRALVFNQNQQLVGVTEVSDKAEDAVNTYLPALIYGSSGTEMWEFAHIFPSVGASAWHKIR
ncbi:glutathione reductase [Ligilactobacillus salitolerans]|uniref:Glutathione reductase n=1 Tax=Ligilactobacillus salitolerans TaxID=1808352 RepID=A0A401ISD2_9LACO|nr:NAD(P)/FAD-dependent oxidoreductase [Ligilactobacillus salitolerans]GBG94438.1 glutathione reductase [Ligilactobacillus salitolerans]